MYYTCMLNHCLEWDKWVLTNFDHDRQWFHTLISPSNESAAVTVDCISRLSGPVRLAIRYTTVGIHCRDRRYEWGGGKMYFSGLWNISGEIFFRKNYLAVFQNAPFCTSIFQKHQLVLLNAVSKLTSFPYLASHVPHFATPAPLTRACIFADKICPMYLKWVLE